MESLDPQCTPLKKTYDSCFNRWFERYLSIADHSQYAAASSPPSSASSTSSSSNKRTGSRGVAVAEGAVGLDSARQKAMTKSRDEYEKDCGAAWAKYRDCIGVRSRSQTQSLLESGADVVWDSIGATNQRAIDVKQLRPLLEAARREDPLEDAKTLAADTAGPAQSL